MKQNNFEKKVIFEIYTFLKKLISIKYEINPHAPAPPFEKCICDSGYQTRPMSLKIFLVVP